MQFKKWLYVGAVLLASFGMGLFFADHLYYYFFSAVVWAVCRPECRYHHELTWALYPSLIFIAGLFASHLLRSLGILKRLAFTIPFILTAVVFNYEIYFFFWAQYQTVWVGVVYKVLLISLYVVGLNSLKFHGIWPPKNIPRLAIVMLIIFAVLAGEWYWEYDGYMRPSRRHINNTVSVPEQKCINEPPRLYLGMSTEYVDRKTGENKPYADLETGKPQIEFSWGLKPSPYVGPEFCQGVFYSLNELHTGGGWYLVSSRTADPEYNRQNRWYRSVMKYSWNWITLEELGAGTHHFRVCLFYNNQCVLYSNDLKVEILKTPEGLSASGE